MGRLRYKSEMAKTIERWLLFKFVGGEFTPLSQPFKTKQLAEKARLKYQERERKADWSGRDSIQEVVEDQTDRASIASAISVNAAILTIPQKFNRF